VSKAGTPQQALKDEFTAASKGATPLPRRQFYLHLFDNHMGSCRNTTYAEYKFGIFVVANITT